MKSVNLLYFLGVESTLQSHRNEMIMDVAQASMGSSVMGSQICSVTASTNETTRMAVAQVSMGLYAKGSRNCSATAFTSVSVSPPLCKALDPICPTLLSPKNETMDVDQVSMVLFVKGLRN